MRFEDFARSYGLIVSHVVADGRFHRVPTEDHPRKRNGAYVLNGDHGAVQNWATMDTLAHWKEEGETRRVVTRQIPVEDFRARHDKARLEVAALLAECARARHPYLARKGFHEAMGLVHPCGDLMIPMRDCQKYDTVNTIQRINVEGEKKFHPGGKAKGSVFRLGADKGKAWLVEGAATGYSVAEALKSLHQQPSVVVCFSAGNLTYVSQFVRRPAFVFADNDESQAGQKAAIATGMPYCMADVGDANDLHLAKGIRAVASLMRELQDSVE